MDPLQAINDAEKEIAARIQHRMKAPHDQRTFVAAEQVADELTRIRAELKTVRMLYATSAAMGRR